MPIKKSVARPWNQFTLLNAFLWVLLLACVEYFFLSAIELLDTHFSYWLGLGGVVAVVWGLLVLLEMGLVLKLESGKNPRPFLTPLFLTHLPWVWSLALSSEIQVAFPDPHNFLFRKLELLLGLIWVTHIFAFCGWLLWRTRKNGKPVSYTFGIVAIFFFVGITFWTTRCDLSGDEPHYLLMAQSLIRHGDLNLMLGYQNKEYESFYHRGVLVPQGLDHIEGNKLYSYHPLGPVLLVLPGFFLWGRLGAALTIALLSAWALYLSLLVLEMTGAEGKALQAVGVVGLFSSPFLLFSGLIYPEIPTACLMALTLYWVLKKKWFALGLTLGVFLWMHNRNVLLVIPLVLYFAVDFWIYPKDKLHKALFLAAGFLIPTALLALYFRSIYGVWTPLGAHNEAFTSLFRLSHFWIGFLGLILDQECGLWFYFAIFGMAVAGSLMLFSSKNPLRYLVIWTFLFYYLFMCFYENLGLTPGTRYMVSVTPLLLFMLYHAFVKLKFNLWELLTLVSFMGGFVINWALAVVPWMRYNKLDGENMMLSLLGQRLHLRLAAGEPSFQAPVIEPHSYYISIFWFVVTASLSVWFWKEHKER